MKTKIVDDESFLPAEVFDSVTDRVVNSLNHITTQDGKFIVNDTLYYKENSGGKITACVMNSANFLSSTFQKNLAKQQGAKGETKLYGQSIDGFIETKFSGLAYKIINKKQLLKAVYAHIKYKKLSERSVYTIFPKFQGMFVDRILFDIEHLPKKVHCLFKAVEIENSFNIGVEFETGNIASSFRALNKLFVLFQHGHIDAGVLVTCTDKKSAATRIWPVSNRNGSFQELKRRNYLEQVSLPLISIGFAPDNFSDSALFLGKKGNLYAPKETNRTHSNEVHQIMIGQNNDEILLPKVTSD